MDQGTIAYWLTWVGTGAWVVCFWWMHRISTRQDALLTELRELARTQHDILREVHLDVGESENEGRRHAQDRLHRYQRLRENRWSLAHGFSPCATEAAVRARSARRAPAVVSRQASTADPRSGTAQAPHRTQDPPVGAYGRSNATIAHQVLWTRCPHGGPLFASWPWPRHTWMLVGSS